MKYFLAFLLVSVLTAVPISAAQYKNFDYAAVCLLESDFEWENATKVFRTVVKIPAAGDYNLYLDMASQERNQVTLLIDGKELPSLELPGAGRKPGRFLRIKLAAGISLSSGGHEVEIRANAPWKKMTIKALLAEKVTIPHRWQLVWNEEFEQDGFPDPAKWRGEEGLLRNQEPQYYTIGRRENLQIKDGILRITAKREKWLNRFHDPNSKDWRKNRPDAEVTSAQIDTFYSAAWQYGKIEARIKVIAGTGRWPAFWTMGVTGRWPAQGELDIMEYFGKSNNRITQALHKAGIDGKDHAVQNWNIKTRDGSPMEGRFHLYSVIWDENKVEWFIDNRKTFEAIRQPGLPWCVDNPQYIILNHAVGSYSGKVPPEIDSMSFYIDYVRVYQ